jgi:hypothetical protein
MYFNLFSRFFNKMFITMIGKDVAKVIALPTQEQTK